ncbi:MAG: MetQ/NlpA family ABC transporter substrate-binding protein [Actinomycetaceae bacterium]|nr:MetQ/NlpA family ABC transporter substrate-binding protein [Actinomycetaceae bacterium]
MRISRLLTVATASVAALALTACGSSDDGSQSSEATGGADTATIKVSASPVPHADILRFINENLAADAGLTIEVIESTDYNIPNEALQAGDVDANFYQTVPYLEEKSAERGFEFTPGKGVHLEPLGVYSSKIKDLKELKDGAQIGIIADTQNQARALKLLAANNIVTLPESGDITIHTVKTNGDYKFTEVEGAQLVRSLDDVDIAVINGNYAQEGGLSITKDALAAESPENNPAVNVLVWRSADNDKEAIKKLEELLHSPEVKKFIEQTWPDGSVIPAF